ncbi:hypothetical protein EXIGLDRAFT_240750 [Exidia glandulosa HHB12029]|uniref:Protein PBN1 n=1 Tax=Exidia glandulosa HHB12029 TaxID=1314781 RepID=A0A165Q6J8_EXIGL|nr:hypothetical protein EXIGLDRAFT_240750 [Exidia glandulosa HHB12029]
MLPHGLLLLLAAALAAADDALDAGHVARTTLGLHLGLTPRPPAARDSVPRGNDDSHSYVTMARQSRLYRIPPAGRELVRLVYALCAQPHPSQLEEHDLLDRWLNPQSRRTLPSKVNVQLHPARPDESLDALERRIRTHERLYDDNSLPIYPHWLSLGKHGWGAWEGELQHGAIVSVDVDESWIEYADEEDEPIEVRFAESPVDAHFDFEIERLPSISRRAEPQKPFNATAPLRIPVLGDTTTTQAIIFSPPFTAAPSPQEQGLSTQYPNYSLPLINPSLDQLHPPANDSLPDWHLEIEHTVAFERRTGEAAIPHRLALEARGSCIARRAVQKRQHIGPTFSSKEQDVTANVTLALRGTDGWRLQWIIEGLLPGLNYTAYIMTADNLLGPIYFATKNGTFPRNNASITRS